MTTPIPAAAVEAYVSAVNDYLAGLTHAQWNAQRNGPEALAHVARIGLTAALPHLSAARGVVEAWQQGYHQGVLDERTSEANIGIAGFGAKVEPARINPYLTLASRSRG